MQKYNFQENLEVVLSNKPAGNCAKCIFRDCRDICANYMVCTDEDAAQAVYWKMRRGGQCDAILSAQEARNRGVDTQKVCRQKIAAALRVAREHTA